MSSTGLTASPPTRAIVIPPEGPLREIALETREGSHLKHLQELVGGYVEALRIPAAFDRTGRGTCYVNEDGKRSEASAPNYRASDFLVPGVGLFVGDYVAGTMVLVGFDPETGEHLSEPPEDVVRRARLIAAESGAGWDVDEAAGTERDLTEPTRPAEVTE